MPTDLTDVLERTSAPVMHIDPYAVVSGGRRRRLRRRLTTGGAALAVAAVVAGGALASPHLASRPERPAPAATTITSSTVTVPLQKNLYSYRLASPTVVEFGRVVQGSNEVVDVQRASIVNGQAWVRAKNRPAVVLGIMPATFGQPNDLQSSTYQSSSESETGALLAGTFLPYAQAFEDPTGAERFKGRVYTNENGDVFGPSGRLPRVEFAANGGSGPVTIWLEPRQRMFGHLLNGDLAPGTPLPPDQPAIQRTAEVTSSDTGSGPGTETGWFVGVAPTTASTLEARLTDGTTILTPLTTKPLDDDYTAFAVEYRGAPGQQVQLMLRWRTPQGWTSWRAASN
jgi:hypothetical protein